MTTHSSATTHEETPHATNSITNKRISDTVRHRAQLLIEDKSIDDCARGFIQYTLENEDPYLTKLVRRINARESILTMSPLSRNRRKTSSSAKVTT